MPLVVEGCSAVSEVSRLVCLVSTPVRQVTVDFPSPLNGPEHGVEHGYRVLGLNRADEGRPSNAVRAVL